MKIIFKGTLPGAREYQASCTNCKTIFEFVASEGKIHVDQRDGDYVTIACPVCYKSVYKNLHDYKK